jgi:hypothetical protein
LPIFTGLLGTVENGSGWPQPIYRFADMDRLRQGMGSDRFKALIADYDRTWPGGVTRTREILSLVEEAVTRTSA